MQNTLKNEANQQSTKNKSQLFALLGILLTTAFAGGIYYFLQPESVPPSLEVKRNTYQGFSKDVEFGSVKWEKADLKVNEDKIAELKKTGVNTDTAVKAEKNRTNILFALKDTNLKEIIDATSRIEGGRVIWAVYQGTFIMTQNDYFNTVDSKGNVVSKIVDTSNTVETEKIKIKENEAVFLMADYDASNPLLRSELDVPAKDVTLDSLTKGWHVLAMRDAAVLLKDIGSTTYSLFGTRNNKDFTKLKTLDEKKNYNKIVWINVKVDKLTKEVVADKTEVVLAKIDEINTTVALGKDSAKSQEIKQGTKGVSLAKFDVTSNQKFSINKVTLDYTGVSGTSGANDIATLYVSVTSKGITASSTQAKPKFPLSIGMDYTLDAQDLSAVIEVKADMASNAYVNPTNNKHAIKLTEIGFGGFSTLTKTVEGNTMTVIQSDPLTADEAAKAKAAAVIPSEVKNLAIYGSAFDSATGIVDLVPANEIKFKWDAVVGTATNQYKDAKTQALSYTLKLTEKIGGKSIWELPQTYGFEGEGVTEQDETCFTYLYDSSGKELLIDNKKNRDWTCNSFIVPSYLKTNPPYLAPKTAYIMEVTAHDGMATTVTKSVEFTTGLAEVKYSPLSYQLTTPSIFGVSCVVPGQTKDTCYLVIEKPSFYTGKTITDFIIKEDGKETTVPLSDTKITTKTTEDYYLYGLTDKDFVSYFQLEHKFAVKIKATDGASDWGTYTQKAITPVDISF